MSIVDLHQPAIFKGVALHAPKWAEEAFRQIGETIRLRRRYVKSVAEMRALSDRTLTDLGICRSDIRRIARDAVHGEQ
jgi:uncharacterized protein YjiS (DUF1127 family)